MPGGRIEWAVSWNPIRGKCPHGCHYCYMNSYFRRFKLDPALRLDEKTLRRVPKAERIFVCSSLDMFAREIPDSWIRKVLDRVVEYPDRDFFLLTKNPARYYYWHGVPDKFQKGISLPITKAFYGTSWDGLPFTKDNVSKLKESAPPWASIFVSFEPLLADPSAENIRGVQWIIIGADSRPGARRPAKAWADILIEKAREICIPVFVKENYNYPERIQEYPGV